MLKVRKAQATAEYALLIGAVVAIAVGILGAALRSGVRAKTAQSAQFLDGAGIQARGLRLSDSDHMPIYQQEITHNIVKPDYYQDQKIMHQGGAERSIRQQYSQTISVTAESLDPVEPDPNP